MTSRVVPAVSDTMAASRRASRLSSEDLPALGGPMMAIVRPSRSRSPRRSSRWAAISACSCVMPVRHLVGDAGRQVLVGEIDRRLEMGQRAQAQGAPILVEAMQRAIHLLQRQPALLVGLGRDQVGDGLGLGEVELAVLEGAARELAGLGQAAETQLADRLQGALDHGAPAMQVQLGHGLAGLGVGRLEPHDQPAIDRLAAFRIEDGCAAPCAAAPAAPDRAPSGRARRRAAR